MSGRPTGGYVNQRVNQGNEGRIERNGRHTIHCWSSASVAAVGSEKQGGIVCKNTARAGDASFLHFHKDDANCDRWPVTDAPPNSFFPAERLNLHERLPSYPLFGRRIACRSRFHAIDPLA